MSTASIIGAGNLRRHLGLSIRLAQSVQRRGRLLLCGAKGESTIISHINHAIDALKENAGLRYYPNNI
jgi:hypothetical protein